MNVNIKKQPLESVVDILSGFAFKREWFQTQGEKIIRIGDIKDGFVSSANAARIDVSKHYIQDSFKAKTNDILMALSGATTGKCGVVLKQDNGAYVNQRIAIIRPKSHELSIIFRHLLASKKVRENLIKQAGGSAQPNLSPTVLKTLEVPVFTDVQEKRIATILDKADAIRRKRQRAIELADEFLRGVFLDRFGDPVGNPMGWEVLAFGEVVTNLDSKRKPVKEAERAKQQGIYPYYGASGIIDHVDNFLFNETTLLIAEDGMNLIRRTKPIAFIASGKYWVNNHAHVVTENGRVKLNYLCMSINMRDIETFVTGIDQRKLTRSNLDKIPIQVPPMFLQEKLLNIVQIVKNNQTQQRKSVQKANTLFNALTQRAFTGKL